MGVKYYSEKWQGNPMNCTLPTSIEMVHTPLQSRKARKSGAKPQPARYKMAVGPMGLEQFEAERLGRLRPHIERGLAENVKGTPSAYWDEICSGNFVSLLEERPVVGSWLHYTGLGKAYQFKISQAVDLCRHLNGPVSQGLARYDKLKLASEVPISVDAYDYVDIHYPFVHLRYSAKNRETTWVREGYTRTFALDHGLAFDQLLRAIELYAATGEINQPYAMYVFAALGGSVENLTTDQKIDMITREFGL
jgi:hypothetical protein